MNTERNHIQGCRLAMLHKGDCVIHKPFCKLSQDHYDHCSEYKQAYFVESLDGNLLWEKPEMQQPKYSDDPDSEYQSVYWPAKQALQTECITKAYELGGIPKVRHHSNFSEVIKYHVPVREIEERGDLLLDLPIGKFVLHAARVRKGELTSAAGGFDSSSSDTDSPTVSIYGGFAELNGNYYFQPHFVKYSDGTSSGFLGCDMRLLKPYIA